MPTKNPNSKTSEELQKILQAEKKTARTISEAIFNNLDKVLELISDEKILQELEKRIKQRKIKVDFDWEQAPERGRIIRYLATQDYKLDLLTT